MATPEIRFEGFEGEWETKSIEEVTSNIFAGGDTDFSQLRRTGNFPVYANARTNDGLVGYYDEYFRVTAPAVTVTGRGDIGFAKARFENFTPVVRLLVLISQLDSFFLEESINRIPAIQESTGVPQLTAPQISRYRISVPSIHEQQLLGTQFSSLDKLSKISRDRILKLKHLKQSMLVKMFPQGGAPLPEIRFEGFGGNWSEDILENLVNRNAKIESDDYLPRVEYEDIIPYVGRLNKNLYAKKSRKNGVYFEVGDVLYGKLRPYLGNWMLADFEGIAVGDFWVLKGIKLHPQFLYALIQSPAFKRVTQMTTGSKMPRADWSVTSQTLFLYPSPEEQAAIGSYFRQLDQLIELEEAKLTKLTQLKTAFLSKMFL